MSEPTSQTDPCTCPWTDPSTRTYYGDATEPGSEPQCQRQATQEDFLCDPCREGRH